MIAVRQVAVAFAIGLRRAAWFPLAVLGLHVLTGSVIDVYGRWPNFDVPMHVLGGIAAAFFLRVVSVELTARGMFGQPNRLAVHLIVFGATAVIAVGWECAEFVSDRMLLTRWSEDPADLLGDLLLGLLGAGVYLVFAAWRARSELVRSGNSR